MTPERLLHRLSKKGIFLTASTDGGIDIVAALEPLDDVQLEYIRDHKAELLEALKPLDKSEYNARIEVICEAEGIVRMLSYVAFRAKLRRYMGTNCGIFADYSLADYQLISEDFTMAPKKNGRPSIHSKELANEICTRIIEGESLRKICSEPNMPLVSTVFGWVNDDKDGFKSTYSFAQVVKGHTDADRMMEIYSLAETKKITPGQARVMFEILKWSSERRAPKKIGSKHEAAPDFTEPKSTFDFL